jgi:hypothetical protein
MYSPHDVRLITLVEKIRKTAIPRLMHSKDSADVCHALLFRLAFYGLQTNMGLYLKKELGYPADTASQLVSGGSSSNSSDTAPQNVGLWQQVIPTQHHSWWGGGSSSRGSCSAAAADTASQLLSGGSSSSSSSADSTKRGHSITAVALQRQRYHQHHHHQQRQQQQVWQPFLQHPSISPHIGINSDLDAALGIRHQQMSNNDRRL